MSLIAAEYPSMVKQGLQPVFTENDGHSLFRALAAGWFHDQKFYGDVRQDASYELCKNELKWSQPVYGMLWPAYEKYREALRNGSAPGGRRELDVLGYAWGVNIVVFRKGRQPVTHVANPDAQNDRRRPELFIAWDQHANQYLAVQKVPELSAEVEVARQMGTLLTEDGLIARGLKKFGGDIPSAVAWVFSHNVPDFLMNLDNVHHATASNAPAPANFAPAADQGLELGNQFTFQQPFPGVPAPQSNAGFEQDFGMLDMPAPYLNGAQTMGGIPNAQFQPVAPVAGYQYADDNFGQQAGQLVAGYYLEQPFDPAQDFNGAGGMGNWGAEF